MKLLGLLFFSLLCAGSGFDVYIGDSNPCRAAAMVSDAAGNTYVAGSRVFGGLLGVFITKVDSSGNVLFTTTTGGKGSDAATSIAVNSSGNIWVGGNTTSPDFPLINAVQLQPSTAGTTGFILELGPNGSIVFSSYFGGIGGIHTSSSVNGVAVDASGNGYVTGNTMSSDFPVTSGMPDSQVFGGIGVNTISGAFLAKIAAGGGRIVYSGLIAGGASACQPGSTCFLADKHTSGSAIAVDAAGNAYLAGNTDTTDLPTTLGAFETTGLGAFVAKVKADGSGLDYLTYFGQPPPRLIEFAAGGATLASSIAVDATGSVYLTGSTIDPNFPATAGAFQTTYAGPVTSNTFQPGPADAVAAKLTPDGSALAWATYLGGTGVDSATSIALDPSNNVWLAGTTTSANFPNASGWPEGGDFLAELNSSGSALPFSARYPNNTVSTAVAVDSSGTVHAAGVDGIVSAFTPSALPAFEIYGVANAAAGYVTGRIVPGEVIAIYGRNIGPVTPVAYSGTYVPTSLGGVEVNIGGYSAPLLYVSQWQINAVVPLELTGPSNAVQITFDRQSPTFMTVTSPAEPGIFTNSSGIGVFNTGGSFAPGSFASMWVTGLDLSGFTNVADGQIPAAAGSFESSTQVQVLISAASNQAPVPAGILYEGLAPGLVDGVIQINFQVPASGFGTVTLVARGRNSPSAE
jgi:uncharacterized protein (TIGR03437 family)